MPDDLPRAADGLPIDAAAEPSPERSPVAPATPAARGPEDPPASQGSDRAAPDADADRAHTDVEPPSERTALTGDASENGSAAPGAGVIARLADAVQALDRRVEESQRLLAHQTELADRLHAENQRLRSGELRAAQLPLVRDLMRMHDDAGRLLAAATDQATTDVAIMRDSLVDALARNGIESFEPTVGEQFDPRTQTARGVVATSDAALERCIAEVVRAGFMWEDKTLIRAADVRVHRLQQSKDAE